VVIFEQPAFEAVTVNFRGAGKLTWPIRWGGDEIQQIMIEAEWPDDVQSMFRLTIDSNLIAKGVTAAEAHYLVGEVLGAVRHPHPLRGRRSTQRWVYEIATGQKSSTRKRAGIKGGG
jgi:hypothetical protein